MSYILFKESSIYHSVILIWIKITLKLMWISEMQIEHVLANVNKGSRSDHSNNGLSVWSRFWSIQHYIACIF